MLNEDRWFWWWWGLGVVLLLAALVVMISGCQAGPIDPVAAAVIRHGCQQTIELDGRIIADDDCPAWIKQEAQVQALRAKALIDWTRTRQFPLGAPTGKE